MELVDHLLGSRIGSGDAISAFEHITLERMEPIIEFPDHPGLDV
ncbi:hypothetical protein [Paraburkholderia solisilvae]|nr:hypothetical protein [Paraburkholderia solisilvae]